MTFPWRFHCSFGPGARRREEVIPSRLRLKNFEARHSVAKNWGIFHPRKKGDFQWDWNGFEPYFHHGNMMKHVFLEWDLKIDTASNPDVCHPPNHVTHYDSIMDYKSATPSGGYVEWVIYIKKVCGGETSGLQGTCFNHEKWDLGSEPSETVIS